MSDLSEAIVVTLVGMGLIFASLGLLMLIMVALDRVFRPRKPLVHGHGGENGLDALNVAVAEPTEREDEVAAAIVVALEVLAERQRAAPRTTVLTPTDSGSAWRAAGRVL